MVGRRRQRVTHTGVVTGQRVQTLDLQSGQVNVERVGVMVTSGSGYLG